MEQLKYADMKPIYEKDSRNGEESCRPVNIFTIISKINESCLFSQLNSLFDTIFSKLQYGFRKVFCVYTVSMIKKWRESNGGRLADLN